MVSTVDFPSSPLGFCTAPDRGSVVDVAVGSAEGGEPPVPLPALAGGSSLPGDVPVVVSAPVLLCATPDRGSVVVEFGAEAGEPPLPLPEVAAPRSEPRAGELDDGPASDALASEGSADATPEPVITAIPNPAANAHVPITDREAYDSMTLLDFLEGGHRRIGIAPSQRRHS